MVSKFRESNTNVEVVYFMLFVIVMGPKLSRSAYGAHVQLQKFLCATGP